MAQYPVRTQDLLLLGALQDVLFFVLVMGFLVDVSDMRSVLRHIGSKKNILWYKTFFRCFSQDYMVTRGSLSDQIISQIGCVRFSRI
jgi:hypothetical protein